MSLSKDSGNLVMLVLAAAVAGAMFGDGAFKVVIYVGMAAMVIGTIAAVSRTFLLSPVAFLAGAVTLLLAGAVVGNGSLRFVCIYVLAGIALVAVLHFCFGEKLWLPIGSKGLGPVHANADRKSAALLEAVEKRKADDVERLVLVDNVSPFMRQEWRGHQVSANELARTCGYLEASRFFAEWSNLGQSARFDVGDLKAASKGPLRRA